MLDSNAYDAVLEDEALLSSLLSGIKTGRVSLVCTHIQMDELGKAAEPKRSEFAAILRFAHQVPTAGAVWDVSRWDAASWGSASQDGIVQEITAGNERHTRDALIASTSGSICGVFVTSDRRLSRRMARLSIGCQVWNIDQLKAWLADCV
jgi:hypothetical protein